MTGKRGRAQQDDGLEEQPARQKRRLVPLHRDRPHSASELLILQKAREILNLGSDSSNSDLRDQLQSVPDPRSPILTNGDRPATEFRPLLNNIFEEPVFNQHIGSYTYSAHDILLSTQGNVLNGVPLANPVRNYSNSPPDAILGSGCFLDAGISHAPVGDLFPQFNDVVHAQPIASANLLQDFPQDPTPNSYALDQHPAVPKTATKLQNGRLSTASEAEIYHDHWISPPLQVVPSPNYGEIFTQFLSNASPVINSQPQLDFLPDGYNNLDSREGQVTSSESAPLTTPEYPHVSFRRVVDISDEPSRTPAPAKSSRKRKRKTTVNCTDEDDPKRRKQFLPDAKLETRRRREARACLRCRDQKIRCPPVEGDYSAACMNCISVTKPKIFHISCFYPKITDAKLLDTGEHPRFSWTRRWRAMEMTDITDWRSDTIKTIQITQDIGGACYQLQVREFVPVEGDSLAVRWNSKGGSKSLPCAPYAIADMKSAAREIVAFANRNVLPFIDFWIDETDKLMRHTYDMVNRWSWLVKTDQEKKLLQSVLRLWMASRMCSRQERISSDETLGMSPQNVDDSKETYGNYLLPPVLTAQLEIIVTTQLLSPMQAVIIQQLQKLVEKKEKKQHWFTIYLCTFVLLHSCALFTKAEMARAAREGTTSQSPFYSPKLVEELHNGAKILLVHFHYICKGAHPFSSSNDWSKPETAEFADLDKDQVEFIQETVSQIRKRDARFKSIIQQKDYSDEYYFIAQMYETDWQPSMLG